ncbi:MAG: histidine triad nucleotide-binding protein [Candidatus Goldiibacteriota bacterium]
MDDCMFCRIIKGEIPSIKIYEDELVYAFEDINPQAPVHVLIIPKKHFASLNEMKKEDEQTVGHIFLIAAKIAEEKGIEKAGYRTVFNTNKSAGQVVFHLHAHLLGGRDFSWPPG